MSIDKRITTALKTFKYDVSNKISFAKDATYFAFNYTVIPSDYGDDAPCHERYLAQVHFFCPLNVNITALKKRVRQELYAAGFTWASIEDLSDENGRHIVFEFEDAEGVDLYGDA